uniref:Uncharacterized protein n=1 Tax=Lotus japonicus TaxID=34305 RepID=I3T6F7_LOTJA|nr:unknown [Lotus japonicus]
MIMKRSQMGLKVLNSGGVQVKQAQIHSNLHSLITLHQMLKGTTNSPSTRVIVRL